MHVPRGSKANSRCDNKSLRRNSPRQPLEIRLHPHPRHALLAQRSKAAMAQIALAGERKNLSWDPPNERAIRQ